jgi:hypothetical protein
MEPSMTSPDLPFIPQSDSLESPIVTAADPCSAGGGANAELNDILGLMPSQFSVEYSSTTGLDATLILSARQLFLLGDPDHAMLDLLFKRLADAVYVRWGADFGIQQSTEGRGAFADAALEVPTFSYGKEGVVAWSVFPAAARNLRRLVQPDSQTSFSIPPFRSEDLVFPVICHELAFEWKGHRARLELIFEKDTECWCESCHVYLDDDWFDEYGEDLDDGWHDAVRDCFGTVDQFMTGDKRHETPITEDLTALIEARLEMLLAQENANV